MNTKIAEVVNLTLKQSKVSFFQYITYLGKMNLKNCRNFQVYICFALYRFQSSHDVQLEKIIVIKYFIFDFEC